MSEQNMLNLDDSNTLESVETYKFEPIKGYPMLNWHGKRPFKTTQYYPAQKKEVYGDEVNGWINKIYWGDNLQVMSHLLKDFRGKVDLVYIDPPFDSKADYKKKIKIRGKKLSGELNSFEEKQYTDIWTNDEYLQFLYERLILIRELLSENGAIFVHCDPKKSAHIKLLLDEIFGEDNFQNEIIWHYEKWTSPSSVGYQKNHDNIYYYSNGKNTFNKIMEVTDNLKKKYEQGYLFGGGGGSEGLVVYDPEKPKVKELIASGKYKVVYADMEGKPLSDVWKIPFINPVALERTNYPTQKPEALIERIISSTSDVGSLVFDCFMGSGTTQSLAMKLGRRFIGADINFGATQTTIKRLLKVASEIANSSSGSQSDVQYYTGFEVFNVNNYEIFRNPVEAKELLMEALEIEPLSDGVYDGQKDGYMVKVMPVNRISTREDLNELLSNFPYKTFEQRKEESPNKAVESIMLVCMGHEPDLKAHLEQESGYKLNVQVVDILRDKANIQFKRDSEAEITLSASRLEVINFFPMNLLQKLSLQKESVSEWRELVESIIIDWNYAGAAMEPGLIDIPSKDEFVQGVYDVPSDAGTVKIKITDLLSESYEEVFQHG